MTGILKIGYFALMYFKFSGRHNPHTGKSDWYYRLFESYRNREGGVCHRTMLNVVPDVDINARSGVYFLRTTLETDSEELLWQCYNIIREIEATFYAQHIVMQSDTIKYGVIN